MAVVVGLQTAGGAYTRNGRPVAGWSTIKLDNGETLRLHEMCFDALVKHADSLGHDTKRMRERLDTWVATGTMPEHDPKQDD